MKIKPILFVIAMLGSVSVLKAQTLKVAYINTQDLIYAMPEVKAANDSIQAAKAKVEGRIKSMVDELRLKAANLEKRKNEIAPIQYDKEVQLLQAEQKKITEFEQLGQQELALKSEGLFNPIQNRVNLIIKEVAAEEGYAYVIDGSQGTILYADPATNIIEKVKAKLQQK
ncbi:MAG TPA: OmpH family outer membrane protein [Saprospiraceae bacterium]|nr:OmpH family outer membrane protein [Saprospiraceae bacterium]